MWLLKAFCPYLLCKALLTHLLKLGGQVEQFIYPSSELPKAKMMPLERAFISAQKTFLTERDSLLHIPCTVRERNGILLEL